MNTVQPLYHLYSERPGHSGITTTPGVQMSPSTNDESW